MNIPTGTERLSIRPWNKGSDFQNLFDLCSNRDVMRHFPAILSEEETKSFLDRLISSHQENGFCFLPIEDRNTGKFLGFAGLHRPRFSKPLAFSPCVEIGWRLLPEAWGQGLASEAARAWLEFGFESAALDEIVSFTAVQNIPSQKVMQRIGMLRDLDGDFDHPSVPDGHHLQRHVLYRLKRNQF
ncbi:GNAT family N-acetyltransferase [Roseibium sp. RKSG952]|uniref:GNAT family N-acetyltransferase n=1 Tax=Roseibium sp. RKSG952 TaxID=2529384 RepID=UPI0012BCA352|nr:GNAT family N-acetyltransferase [Roseibium sp. RKSG952]MTI01092.1 N-acetyltransferase [Roseibium sp. RKSG952]